jgi:hypothetical protein
VNVYKINPQETRRNTRTYKEPGRFLLEGDLELAALRPRRLGALAVEGDALVDQLQLLLEQRYLVIQSPASLCIAETRTSPNSVPIWDTVIERDTVFD